MAKKDDAGLMDNLIPLTDAARVLGLTYHYVWGMATKGILPGTVRIGQHMFVDRRKLEAYAHERERRAEAKSKERT